MRSCWLRRPPSAHPARRPSVFWAAFSPMQDQRGDDSVFSRALGGGVLRGALALGSVRPAADAHVTPLHSPFHREAHLTGTPVGSCFAAALHQRGFSLCSPSPALLGSPRTSVRVANASRAGSAC